MNRKMKKVNRYLSGRWMKKPVLVLLVFYLMSCGSCTNPLSEFIEKLVYDYGDTGPAGGTIIDFNYIKGSWYYTEVAPAGWYLGGDDPVAEWGGYSTFIDVTSEAYGAGIENTKVIVEALEGLSETGRAAQLCDQYEITHDGKVYGDWVLPSLGTVERLHHMDFQVEGIFMNDNYWTSSEVDATMAVSTIFSDSSTEAYEYKNVPCRVRPVRFF